MPLYRATASNLANLVAADGDGPGAGGFLKDSDVSSGPWTPVLTFAVAGDLAVTYGTQVGRYLKIGPLVLVTINLQTSGFTHTTASGTLTITGLPFTPINTTSQSSWGAGQFRGITKANFTSYSLRANANSTALNIFASGSGQTPAALTAADTPTGGTFIAVGSLSFETAA